MAVLSILEMNTVLGWNHACGSLDNMITAIKTPRNPMDNLRSKLVCHLRCYQVLTGEIRRLSRCLFSAISSDRFQELVFELRQFAEKVRMGDDSCRGIVFVKMRKTCTKLCEELIKDPLIREYLKPQRYLETQYSTVQCSIVQYSAVQCSIVQYSTVYHFIVKVNKFTYFSKN